MAALRKSLGEPVPSAAAEKPAPQSRGKRANADDARRQPGLKLPIAGGRKKAAAAKMQEPAAMPAEAETRPRKKA